ncbi:S-adenosyl-L-methionine-dependent methyltransferase [Macrolepiota fuliginosa MF-IS2]|uniref:S-adenosyl-L-methionine-dependent methyltransferase n=1 Tax=Macrolepiota fuliginosa MF-IS2 TaxID=1400762 RepID=A0A9P6CBE6_9AGAR|nr:S-adenosyl-L-methionine-dependent methyltransferase [Macrolepiota fuliginosa MF-IS2]
MTGIVHEEKRKYTNTEGAAYHLPHDDEERWRLSLQSNLFLRTYDNKVLHAPVELKDEDWVLETGSGTGIWLEDLAKQTPTKPQYIGTDIVSLLFPEPATLPSNMKFEIQSVLRLPPDWTNKFTIVHQRLLIAGLRTHEWEQATKEMYRVLKPGGWVQLLELDIWTSGPALAKHRELLYRHSDRQGTMWRNIAKCMPDFLKQSGFVNLHQDVRKTPLGVWAGRDGIDARDNVLSLLRGLKTPILKGGGYGVVESESEYDGLVAEIQEEIDHTPGSEAVWSMFWAQKPEECV